MIRLLANLQQSRFWRAVQTVQQYRRSACCRSCGSDEHILTDCPVLYWSDTNTDHHIDWINSKVGKAWAQQGHKKRMPELILPGYEKLVLLQPLGTPPNAMNSVADNNNNNKRSRDQSNNNPNNNINNTNNQGSNNQGHKFQKNNNQGYNNPGRGGRSNFNNQYQNQNGPQGGNQGGGSGETKTGTTNPKVHQTKTTRRITPQF